MKVQKYKSLGLNVNLSVPETVDEFDKNAKRAGAALDEAINNVVYRGALADFRYFFLHGIDADAEKNLPALDGVEDYVRKNKIMWTNPETKQAELAVRHTRDTGRKDKDNEPILTYEESEADYFNRVLGCIGKEATFFQDLADKVSARITFDASQRERKPAKPKKLADKYKESAKQVLAGPKKDKFIADYKKLCQKDLVLTGDAEKDVESMGWAIKEFSEAKAAQALASIV